ncbi:MAG: UbiX family flavin prenyltransferase [Candidatus Altiarchaeales archaeon]|nr:UbiX family flavin prenyltransferase [Candidatus Altiarchaeales archaeon]
MKIILAVTGASGVVLAGKLVKALKEHEIHLIVSEGAKKVASAEKTPLTWREYARETYDDKNLSAVVSSSSFLVDAMIICPCSMKTLSAVANGYARNLVARCADNMLKMRKPLILVPRETPLSLPNLENMVKSSKAGATIIPPVLSYYHLPKSLDDAGDFVAGKILDVLGVENNLYARWKGK